MVPLQTPVLAAEMSPQPGLVAQEPASLQKSAGLDAAVAAVGVGDAAAAVALAVAEVGGRAGPAGHGGAAAGRDVPVVAAAVAGSAPPAAKPKDSQVTGSPLGSTPRSLPSQASGLAVVLLPQTSVVVQVETSTPRQLAAQPSVPAL
ncbi:MAG: hypothetical protein U1F43_16125 [Myxococcota bacterium]